MTTLGLGLLINQDVHTPTAAWVWFNIIVGIGFGILFPALMYPLQAATTAVDPKNIASAVGIFGCMRVIGQTVGVAIGGAIFQNQIRSELSKSSLLASQASKYSQDAQELVPVIRAMTPGAEKDQLLQAYANALKVVWGVTCAISFVAGVASLWTEGISLNKKMTTDQGLKDGKGKADEEKASNAESK